MSQLSRRLWSVYLLGDGLLFDDTIAYMLSSNSNLRVIRRVYMDDGAFLTDVSLCRPDVILMNEIDQINCMRMLALLSQISLVADLRVIAMSLKNNNIKIFDQPADQRNRQTGVSYTIKNIADWNELFDFVRGKAIG